MKLKINEIERIAEGSTALLETEIPGSIALKLAMNNEAMKEPLTAYYKQRQGLIEKYGEKIEDGTRYKFTEENGVKLSEDLAPLLDVEVEITLQTISGADVDKLGNVRGFIIQKLLKIIEH